MPNMPPCYLLEATGLSEDCVLAHVEFFILYQFLRSSYTFNVDFEVMPDGKLLFFEANASMRLLNSAHPDMPRNPQEAEDAFMAGFDRYLEGLKSAIN